MTRTRDRRLVFFAGAAAVLLLEWALIRSSSFGRGGPPPAAVFVDVMVVLPLSFILFVLRPARRPVVQVAPVLAASAIAAGVLLAGRPETAPLLRAGGVVAEAAVLAYLFRRLRLAAGELRASEEDDLLLRLGALSDPLLRLLGAELAVVYYAFAGPFLRRPLREGDLGYTETSGAGGLIFGLGLLLGMEGLAVHLLLHAFSARLAWALAALNVYALVWLAAAYQAARLRPVHLSPDLLLVRTSLLWTAPIPRASIASIARADAAPRGSGVLRAAFGTAPNLLLTLRTPVIARGPLGIQRSVTRVALFVDAPERLVAGLVDTA
jgi:hypothetical protein